MTRLRLAITTARDHFGEWHDIEQVVGHGRIFRQGTDDRLFVDCRNREEADLTMVNLNQIPGVRAHILNDAH